MVTQITVTPEQRIFDAENRQQQLARLRPLHRRHVEDITRQAVYESNDPDIAEVNEPASCRR